MGYKASGKIHKIFDTEQKSASFQAREFVIEVADGQYPQMVKFQLVQDKCNLVDDYSEGDVVTVEFDLRGREWNGKYFTNLQAWRMGRGEDSGVAMLRVQVLAHRRHRQVPPHRHLRLRQVRISTTIFRSEHFNLLLDLTQV